MFDQLWLIATALLGFVAFGVGRRYGEKEGRAEVMQRWLSDASAREQQDKQFRNVLEAIKEIEDVVKKTNISDNDYAQFLQLTTIIENNGYEAPRSHQSDG